MQISLCVYVVFLQNMTVFSHFLISHAIVTSFYFTTIFSNDIY